MSECGLIVRGQRQNQRALAPQFDVDAARAQKLVGKIRPARLTVAAERDQILFTRLGLAARRQHPGCGMTRARSGVAAVEHRHLSAAGEPPGDSEPDYARADDGDARLLADRCSGNSRLAQRGSLRWNDPDRFDGFDLSRAFGAAPLADVVIMGGLRSFGKGEARPAMPQVARADKPDYEDDDGANQRRLGDAEMFEGVTIINRPDGLAEIERRRMQRQSGATRSLREIGREPECNCAACRSRCRTGEIRRFRCTRAC